MSARGTVPFDNRQSTFAPLRAGIIIENLASACKEQVTWLAYFWSVRSYRWREQNSTMPAFPDLIITGASFQCLARQG
jgi:hypothetical protein